MRSISTYLIIIIMTAVIILSGYNLWKMSERYIQEAQIKNSVAKYHPEYVLNTGTKETASVTDSNLLTETKENRFITDLQNEVNEDIVGWLTIPDTQIDYPFVISHDNDYYLRRDLYGNYALAGTIFMDYRCYTDTVRSNFTDFNTVIYGHNMNNGSMFGELSLFADEGFFESNKYGTIFLKDNTYTLEFFAYMIVRSNDQMIYDPYKSASDKERNEFFEYVKKTARNYREVTGCHRFEPVTPDPLTPTDINIVTLSTCSYEFNGARIVLLAIIVPEVNDKR